MAFSIFPPGWPAFLAVGVALGAGWLVNPLLAAACVPLAHRVFLGLADRRTADVGVTLMAVSPAVLAAVDYDFVHAFENQRPST